MPPQTKHHLTSLAELCFVVGKDAGRHEGDEETVAGGRGFLQVINVTLKKTIHMPLKF